MYITSISETRSDFILTDFQKLKHIKTIYLTENLNKRTQPVFKFI